TYLGALDVVTDASGQATFTVPFADPAGEPWLSATATDPAGNTSEISPSRRVGVTGLGPDLRSQNNGPLIFKASTGTGLALVDPDQPPSESIAEITLSVTDGTLTLSATAGLSGSGDGTASLHYQGTLADLNAALDGLRFDPPRGIGSV